MAFSTGTASTLADLITALHTFATANGWLGSGSDGELNTAAGKMALRRNSVYVSFRWNTGTPLHMGVYQALGFTPGNDPGTHPNDSGNGAVSSTSSTILTERNVESINNGPYTYWFFEQDVYLHVCVESAADIFKHFGFGTLIKTGDWTGGEYAYGHYKVTSGAISVNDTMLVDGLFSSGNPGRSATVHIESLPNQVASGKWGQIWGDDAGAQNDTAGVAKANVQGGFRGGPTATPFGRYSAGLASGAIPMYPLELYYRDIANSRAYFLGYVPDVCGMNMRHFSPRQVVTIGGEQWYIFPAQQKTIGSTTTGTNNLGIAYRRDNG